MKLTRKKIAIGVGLLMVIVTTLVVAASLYISFNIGVAYGEKRLSEFADASTLHISNKEVPENLGESVDFEAFWQAWALLEDRHVGFSASSTEADDLGPTEQEKLWGAIRGLASAYNDPYTVFFPPSENELFESDISGEFSGVGMEIGDRDGLLTVVSPLPGTPADRAGVRAQDVIAEIDGVESINMSTTEAVKLIRGQKGTDVTLTLLREGRQGPVEVTITRDTIQVPTIETQLLDDGTFVIALYSFSARSPELFRDALREFADTGSDKLILDLRGNPGGYLQAAVSNASWFLSGDQLVVREDRGEGEEGKSYYSNGYDVFSDDLRLVVLIDGGSASASEILAAALGDNNRAVLVGQNSFGKGSVQEVINLTDDTSLKVTIARWLTPSGDHISEEGIEPDVVVDELSEDSDEDFILDRAIEVINEQDFFNRLR